MHFLAIIPGLIATYVAFTKSPAKAFLYVYLPSLLFLPDYYHWELPGLPDPTFNSSAIFPIGIAFLIKKEFKWRYSITDFLVLGYAVFTIFSEYDANDYFNAQNLAFDTICMVVFPYVLAKGIIEPY